MLLTPKTYKEHKVALYHSQGGKCTLCGRDLDPEIQKNQLDHDHALDGDNAGRVRSLLCIFCNRLDGDVKHDFVYSGLHSRGVNGPEWLRKLADYWEGDYSNNPIHPQYVPDMAKSFSKLNLPEMIDVMDSSGFEYNKEKPKKSELVEAYRKQLRTRLKPKKK